ncbi:DUF4365 domain-containing protein [Mesorhizobium mediterraneum]|uniref:DUF4365 domain-containing protein n=1 Tax=Mesorhizobium mediterraneum TaxID=43617 RepID=A0AB36RBD9_9HYPH|nr:MULTISPECIES: DUF4365 domain-containing protein [Mesorhizobium]PAQ01925.1 hypothetical protein CIT25_10840 [Mesorhizobium mediterraneum]RWP02900.1 MAG: DUF4365 domain-containing protein [Mesorhizobium sp.]TIM49934.1 MAG: DUF4365 domain-containing protein [Mesorhizobium sp.]WIW54133.1 DUF4365 domain-containing protein [Mesorhizobium mediterraneum]
MAILPAAGVTYSQERKGVAALQSYAAAQNQIWRETDTGDVGIDGQLEYVNDNGYATGKLIAVQVKSGPSFFTHATENGWKFYPEKKHLLYWEQFPLPVILVLHDPVAGCSYWVDVRQALRIPRREENAFIEVPKTNLLQETAPLTLFETAGVQEGIFVEDLGELLMLLVRTRCDNASFVLSYFDLFVHGLTNIARSLYYGMDVVDNAVTYNLDRIDSEFGVGLGSVEQDFLFGFVKFLLVQGLADIDYSDCLIDWVDREMQPHFVAPLTKRGRNLVRLIHEREAELVAANRISNEGALRVAQEGFFQMVPESYVRRLPRIWDFQVSIDRDNSSRPKAPATPSEKKSWIRQLIDMMS